MIDYNNFINKKISTVKPSGIRKFFDIANEMDDVISLSIGEPDFQTPWHIREEGINSLKKGKTWYSPNRGFAELREEIAAYYKRRFGIEYDAKKQTLVTVGGSEAIDLVFRTLLDPGDEVIIPEPSFVCYEPLTVMADGVPVIINTKTKIISDLKRQTFVPQLLQRQNFLYFRSRTTQPVQLWKGKILKKLQR